MGGHSQLVLQHQIGLTLCSSQHSAPSSSYEGRIQCHAPPPATHSTFHYHLILPCSTTCNNQHIYYIIETRCKHILFIETGIFFSGHLQQTARFITTGLYHAPPPATRFITTWFCHAPPPATHFITTWFCHAPPPAIGSTLTTHNWDIRNLLCHVPPPATHVSWPLDSAMLHHLQHVFHYHLTLAMLHHLQIAAHLLLQNWDMLMPQTCSIHRDRHLLFRMLTAKLRTKAAETVMHTAQQAIKCAPQKTAPLWGQTVRQKVRVHAHVH